MARPREADPARQRVQQPIIRHQPDAQERNPDRRPLPHHDGVGQQRDAGARADRVTRDGRDHRLFAVGQQPDHALIVLHAPAPGLGRHAVHRIEVAAGAEVTAIAGEHDGMDRRIVGRGLERLDQRAAQIRIERVPFIRPVEPDAANAVRRMIDRQHRHRIPPPLSIARNIAVLLGRGKTRQDSARRCAAQRLQSVLPNPSTGVVVPCSAKSPSTISHSSAPG